jgi:hypothetical protein
VLQPRDLFLLRELHQLRVIDREQARLVAGLRSITRANTRLLMLVRGGYLRHVAVGTVKGGHRYLYVLTRQGAAAVQRPFITVPLKTHAVIAGQPFLEHQLRLNALYLRLWHHPIPVPNVTLDRWRTFTKPLASDVPLIPDAYVEVRTPAGTKAMFVEIDQGTESLRVWRRKAEQYVAFAISGAFPRLFPHPQFRVVVILPTPKRLLTVRACIAGVTTKIFWLTTSESTNGPDFWGPVWHRPQGGPFQSLT